jgi:hypothetical protein
MWYRCEGDGGVDVISAWRDNDDGYPLAILLFHKSSIRLYNGLKTFDTAQLSIRIWLPALNVLSFSLLVLSTL